MKMTTLDEEDCGRSACRPWAAATWLPATSIASGWPLKTSRATSLAPRLCNATARPYESVNGIARPPNRRTWQPPCPCRPIGGARWSRAVLVYQASCFRLACRPASHTTRWRFDLRAAKAASRPLIDLTVSKPTKAGFDYSDTRWQSWRRRSPSFRARALRPVLGS